MTTAPRASTAQDIATNLAAVQARIRRAADRANRDPRDIRLVAVSKTFGPAHVRAAAAAGQVDLGENRVQEALQKIPQTADLPIRWHLVGHLQSNKVRKSVGAFATIHSVDDVELLERLERAASDEGAAPELLLQIDLAGEAAKSGMPPALLRDALRIAAGCRAVRVTGLMILPPYTDDPEGARPFFRQLRGIRDELLQEGVAPALVRELSMGMSHDLEVAVEEGATVVRVGTAIFGPRPQRV